MLVYRNLKISEMKKYEKETNPCAVLLISSSIIFASISHSITRDGSSQSA